MSFEYLGILPLYDPLYNYLTKELSCYGLINGATPGYSVSRLSGSNEVYLYEEIESGARVVGKFFRSPSKQNSNPGSANARREFLNICHLRSYGFTGYPHYVVRPLAYSHELNDLLIEEFSEGESLGSVFDNALYSGYYDRLYCTLQAIAYFLATLHNRTATFMSANPVKDRQYLGKLISTLVKNGDLSNDEVKEFSWYGDQWLKAPWLWQDVQVIIHGDATPANFLLGDGLMVTAIDLERMQHRDRVYDVGSIIGELVHYFLRAFGNRFTVEPFITYFLQEYASHFPDREAAFFSITKRLPFYMGLTLLRIARNNWLSREYRVRLIGEAREILR